jgi:hypothetical protein
VRARFYLLLYYTTSTKQQQQQESALTGPYNIFSDYLCRLCEEQRRHSKADKILKGPKIKIK